MKKNIIVSLLFFSVVNLAASCFAGPQVSSIDAQDAVEVTVYNSNIGLVKDSRHIKLEAGEGELRFMDVASQIMPQTVHVQPADASADFSVLEQNYEYDLMNSAKLLDKYIGRKIKLLTINQMQDKKEIVDAEVLSNNNGPIYKINNEIYLGHPGYQILPEIPEDLIAQPTLTWTYNSRSKGVKNVKVSYLTSGINWKADYVMVVNKDDNQAGLSGWVTLDNQSGTAYKKAKLKLVAGEINRVNDNVYARRPAMRAANLELMGAKAQFQEESFFEYHIYDLQRPTTIKNNQSKQLNLLEASGIKINKEFIVRGEQNYYWGNYGAQSLKPAVNVYLKFKNSKENNLGMPLPAGTIRLYKEDAQKSLQFIGEDVIKHTPKDEDLEVKVGEAFDLVAERKQMNFQQDSNSYDTDWEIILRNHKDSDVRIAVVEPLYGDWKIFNNSVPYKKIDANSIRFDVDVPKGKEVKFTYQVRVERY